MKILDCAQVTFKANKSDLSFVKNLRDVDVQALEVLQKNKMEMLLKLRDAKKVVEAYKKTVNELIENNLEMYVLTAKADLSEMEQYVEVLKAKLHDINLKILAEEEKNY